MANYSDFASFLPSAGNFQNPDEFRNYVQAQSSAKAGYLSSMDQFYEGLDEQRRQFDETHALNRDVFDESIRQYDTSFQQADRQFAESVALQRYGIDTNAATAQAQINSQQQIAQAQLDQTRTLTTQGYDLQREQLAESARQYDQGYGLQEQQLNEAMRQYNQSYGLQEKELDATLQMQQEDLGLKREQLTEGARQFDAGLDMQRRLGFAGLSSQYDIAQMQDDTSRFGIMTNADLQKILMDKDFQNKSTLQEQAYNQSLGAIAAQGAETRQNQEMALEAQKFMQGRELTQNQGQFETTVAQKQQQFDATYAQSNHQFGEMLNYYGNQLGMQKYTVDAQSDIAANNLNENARQFDITTEEGADRFLQTLAYNYAGLAQQTRLTDSQTDNLDQQTDWMNLGTYLGGLATVGKFSDSNLGKQLTDYLTNGIVAGDTSAYDNLGSGGVSDPDIFYESSPPVTNEDNEDLYDLGF
jgi:hypothetical protein